MNESPRPEPNFSIDPTQVFDVEQYNNEVQAQAEALRLAFDEVNRQYLDARDKLLALNEVDMALMRSARSTEQGVSGINQGGITTDYNELQTINEDSTLEDPVLTAVRAPLDKDLLVQVLTLRLKRFDIRTQQLQLEGKHREAVETFRLKTRANLDRALAQAMGNRSLPSENSPGTNYLRQEVTSITAEAGHELDMIHDWDMNNNLKLSRWEQLKIVMKNGRSALQNRQEQIQQERERVRVQHGCRKLRLIYLQNLPTPY